MFSYLSLKGLSGNPIESWQYNIVEIFLCACIFVLGYILSSFTFSLTYRLHQWVKDTVSSGKEAM